MRRAQLGATPTPSTHLLWGEGRQQILLQLWVVHVRQGEELVLHHHFYAAAVGDDGRCPLHQLQQLRHVCSGDGHGVCACTIKNTRTDTQRRIGSSNHSTHSALLSNNHALDDDRHCRSVAKARNAAPLPDDVSCMFNRAWSIQPHTRTRGEDQRRRGATPTHKPHPTSPHTSHARLAWMRHVV